MSQEPELSDNSAGTGIYQSAPTLEAGASFAGRYKLREKLGEGGMGVVYVADQTDPVQRRVALKVIKVGGDSARLLARFEQERQALALMDHPNIAKIFDAGVAGESEGSPSGSGTPFFAMELIKGVPITRYCDDAKLPPRQRLELFIPVCQAVQHAHQKGIIHRDLKPSNILVGLYDGKPVPKVIDFGVAKATGMRLTDESIYTEVGALIGTLEYMSPEQAELNNLDIDTRSDIYALGVVLYELLTGSLPFSRKDLQAAGFAEMLRIIKEQEPPRPSTKLSGSGTLPSIAAVRRMDPKKLTRLMRGELDWITMKCLEKDRSRRYETANQLGLELQRYLADEPVLAGPPSATYRLRKFVLRNKAGVLASSVMLLALFVGVVVATVGLLQARAARKETEQALVRVREEEAATRTAMHAEARESERARKAEKEAGVETDNAKETVEFLLKDLLGQLDANQAALLAPDPELKLRTVVDRAASRAEGRFKGKPRVEGSVQRSLGWIYISLGANAEARPHLERCLQVCRETLGDHRDTWLAEHELGVLARLDGRYDESLRRLVPALEALRRILGPDDADVLAVANDLGTLYLEMGEREKAIPLLDEVLATSRRLGAPARTTYLLTLFPRAMIDLETGRPDLAVSRLTEAIEGLRAAFGESHPFTLVASNNLGSIHLRLGQFPEAEKFLVPALASARKGLGEDHHTTATLMNTLGSLYFARDELDRAEPLFVKAFDILRRKAGELNSNTLLARQNVAVMFQRRDKLPEAQTEFTALLEASGRKLGDKHPTTLLIRSNLAFVRAARNLPDAIEFYEQTLAASKDALPKGHPVTLRIQLDFARLQLRKKNFDRAAALGREAYDLARQTFGPDAPPTQDALTETANAYTALKRHDLLEPILVDRAASMKRQHGEKSEEHAGALSVLGLTRLELKKFAEAEGVLRQSLAIRDQISPDEWPRHVTASSLGAALAGQKLHAEAEPHLVAGYQGLKKQEKSLPPHARTQLVAAIQRLVELYETTEKKPDAEKWRKELEALKSKGK